LWVRRLILQPGSGSCSTTEVALQERDEARGVTGERLSDDLYVQVVVFVGVVSCGVPGGVTLVPGRFWRYGAAGLVKAPYGLQSLFDVSQGGEMLLELVRFGWR